MPHGYRYRNGQVELFKWFLNLKLERGYVPLFQILKALSIVQIRLIGSHPLPFLAHGSFSAFCSPCRQPQPSRIVEAVPCSQLNCTHSLKGPACQARSMPPNAASNNLLVTTISTLKVLPFPLVTGLPLVSGESTFLP